MDDLISLRKEIDAVDEVLLKAFLSRMEISEKIAKYKKENGLPVENLQREAAILSKRKEQAGVAMADYTEDFFRFLMEESKKLQRRNFMHKKPVLVVMAAGMGSRYGGLKQMDPIGPNGELIIDFSLYDAKKAGFDTAICIIKHEIEEDFKAIMNKGAAKGMNILYAFQDINDIPEGFSVPEGRVKPWGTAHAVLAARNLIDGPFAVINADDYYGQEVFKTMFNYLSQLEDDDKYEYCMAGYQIEKTLTENGTVARGICVKDENENLLKIDERTCVAWHDKKPAFSLDNGKTWQEMSFGTPVSMNFFGFTLSMMKELEARLADNLSRILKENPLKGEYYVPVATSDLVNEGKARVKVLPASDKWFGVTYQADRDAVKQAMAEKKQQGLYPASLW